MKVTNILVISAIALVGTSAALGQSPTRTRPTPAPAADLQPIRSSPAYAELLLRKIELDSSLESLLSEYTEEYPKVKELRIEIGFLKAEIDRLLAVKPADAARLSAALGKLMLKKVELEAELAALRAQYKDEHPDVKKAKRKVELYEAAIREILG
jgi:uncharacterized protein involved in exopolysaccharide biosynthesis